MEGKTYPVHGLSLATTAVGLGFMRVAWEQGGFKALYFLSSALFIGNRAFSLLKMMLQHVWRYRRGSHSQPCGYGSIPRERSRWNGPFFIFWDTATPEVMGSTIISHDHITCSSPHIAMAGSVVQWTRSLHPWHGSITHLLLLFPALLFFSLGPFCWALFGSVLLQAQVMTVALPLRSVGVKLSPGFSRTHGFA